MASAITGSGPEGGPYYSDVDHGDYPPLGAFRRLVREVGLALIVLGLVVLLFVAYQLLGTTLTEQHNQHRLQRQFNQAVAAAGGGGSGATGTGGGTGAGGTGTAGSNGTTGSGTGDVPTIGAGQASTNPSIPTGAAIAHLVIPAIDLDKYVVQGTDESDLSEGPGHYPQTVMPGQVGNAAIAGHRTTYGAPFFRLNSLKTGDPIYLTVTSGKTYEYLVSSSEVVSPNDVSVLDPTTTAQLTLTTCNPRFSATSRLVVVAKLAHPGAKSKKKGTSAKTTVPGATTTLPGATTTVPGATTTLPGATTTVPEATTVPSTTVPASTTTTLAAGATTALNLGEGQHSARSPALFYGALAVLLWILTRLAIHHTRRWRRGLSYVVGIALCLIPLWFCFENVVRLLPPNI